MRSCAFTLLLCCISACTPGPSISNCLPLKQWSKEQQIRAADDLGNVPADSPVFDMFEDYWDLHSRLEACHGIKPAKHKSQEMTELPY